MKADLLLQEMRDSVGLKEPTVYFAKLTDVLQQLTNQLAQLTADVDRLKTNTALAIQWEPKVASDMLSKEITKLRGADKDIYASEILALQQAYAEDRVTQEYADFCIFWQNTLGFHPFLEYK